MSATDFFDILATEVSHEIRYATTAVEDIRLHLYRVWFGLYETNQDKVAILQQLKHLNERLL